MAIPTTVGSYSYPYSNSPNREFLQGLASGYTVGMLKVVNTISASKAFCLTQLFVSVYDATAGSTITVKLKNDNIFVISGAAVGQWSFDFAPSGLQSAVVNTTTLELSVAGATCGAMAFARGYFI